MGRQGRWVCACMHASAQIHPSMSMMAVQHQYPAAALVPGEAAACSGTGRHRQAQAGTHQRASARSCPSTLGVSTSMPQLFTATASFSGFRLPPAGMRR